MAAPTHRENAENKARKPNNVSYVIGRIEVKCNMRTIYKHRSSLKVKRLETPNATYTNRYP